MPRLVTERRMAEPLSFCDAGSGIWSGLGEQPATFDFSVLCQAPAMHHASTEANAVRYAGGPGAFNVERGRAGWK